MPVAKTSVLQIGSFSSGVVPDRLDRGWGYTSAEAEARTGIARWGLTAADMTLYTGNAQPIAGTVLDKMLFTGPIDLRNGGITITRSLFQPTVANKPGQGTRMISMSNYDTTAPPPTKNSIIDCTIDGSTIDPTDAAWLTGSMGYGDIIGCRYKFWGSGIASMWAHGADYSATIASNYVTDLISIGDPATTGNHCDAFTIRDFDALNNRTLTVQANWCECVTANASSSNIIQAYDYDIANVTFTKNLWRASSWCVLMDAHPGSGTAIDFETINFIDDRLDATPGAFGDLTATGGYPNISSTYEYNASNPPTYAGTAIASTVVTLVDPATTSGQQPTGITGKTLVMSEEFNENLIDTNTSLGYVKCRTDGPQWATWYPDWPMFDSQSPGGNHTNTNVNGYYQRNRVATSSGSLVLTAQHDTPVSGLAYSLGMLQSLPGYTISPGTFVEARIQLPTNPSGFWPAGWMSCSNTNTWPPEIDYFETGLLTPGMYDTNVYNPGDSPDPQEHSTTLTSWHTYGVDWQASTIKFYLDGTLVGTTTRTLTTNQYLLFDVAATSSATFSSATMLVDYIRVWK